MNICNELIFGADNSPNIAWKEVKQQEKSFEHYDVMQKNFMKYNLKIRFEKNHWFYFIKF